MAVETSVNIERKTDEGIKQVVDGVTRVRSRRLFIRKCITEFADQVQAFVEGGQSMRRLIDQLDRVEGFTIEVPTSDVNARWDDDTFSWEPTFELSNETQKTVQDIKRNAGITNAEVYRICIFWGLAEFAADSDSPFQYGWEKDQLMKKWYDLKTGLLSVKENFHSILHLRFVLTEEQTRMLIQRDRGTFARFADVYVDEFVQPGISTRMRIDFGDETFDHVEAVIEDYTDVRIPTLEDRVEDFLEAT